MTTAVEGCDLQEWAKEHQPRETLVYAHCYWPQIAFVRDVLADVLSGARSLCRPQEVQSRVSVVSTHTSKSVLLPVFRIELENGISFTMRCNFHNWKVSVDSPLDIEADFMGLFDPQERINPIYCEGFPQGSVYGPYAENKRQFTVDLGMRDYRIFTFFWVFASQVLGIRKQGG